MGEPSPKLTRFTTQSLLRVKHVMDAEGLTIPALVHLSNQASNWDFFPTFKEGTGVEKIVDICKFIKHKKLTVLGYLLALLEPNHIELAPHRTEWLANGTDDRGWILTLLQKIKGMIYSAGNGEAVWKLFIYKEMEDLEIYVPPPSPQWPH
ncbi:uncharacterized protein MELLADRAFT_94962 [Melampsora larici-populina 98AG31]|uniref:Uncharacterized protein n=1 Tax=Melampsora larici-populina (strain 98AG31 / pathotype 3-4-7) TaxID=747676 RepID=F4S8H3_MELLP|nr:uncharacterized protein MELLADRAFT_94962 [Melampsora larici-populina 98AG31]EGF99039.1 hypothetical protein MELLADRAFT_94962 [Melampsora larici-populina 98AG31]